MKYEDVLAKYPKPAVEREVCAAEIRSVQLWRDRANLYASLNLSYASFMYQGFGTSELYGIPEIKRYVAQGELAGRFMWRVMDITGVDRSWNDMQGQKVRVLRLDSYAVAIGHFRQDTWFCPRIEFADSYVPEGEHSACAT